MPACLYVCFPASRLSHLQSVLVVLSLVVERLVFCCLALPYPIFCWKTVIFLAMSYFLSCLHLFLPCLALPCPASPPPAANAENEAGSSNVPSTAQGPRSTAGRNHFEAMFQEATNGGNMEVKRFERTRLGSPPAGLDPLSLPFLHFTFLRCRRGDERRLVRRRLGQSSYGRVSSFPLSACSSASVVTDAVATPEVDTCRVEACRHGRGRLGQAMLAIVPLEHGSYFLQW